MRTIKAVLGGLALSITGSILFVALGLAAAVFSGAGFVYLSSYMGYVTTGSLLAGSFLAGYLNGKRGAFSGGAVGFTICLLSIVFSITLLPKAISLSEFILAVFPGSLLAGMAGACGVNVARAKRKKKKSTQAKFSASNKQ
ncbi:hypothetical protein [Zhaonella formicivorans]|uniref:hypothetical protein n=1 Tax=Zhaonella formicivorans TaxID=2528593 RepID=UPI0010DA1DB7|nr:hypothetical protein [Zhaonella formicivorans]